MARRNGGSGQRVLEFGNPCDRLDDGGVDREEQPAEPRVAQAESRQQFPDEQRAEEMQRDVRDVIAGGVEMPEMPLRGLERGLDRVVLDEAAGCEPDFPEAVRVVQQGVLEEVKVVVHQPVAAERRGEDPESGAQDQERAQQVQPSLRRRRGVHGACGCGCCCWRCAASTRRSAARFNCADSKSGWSASAARNSASASL